MNGRKTAARPFTMALVTMTILLLSSCRKSSSDDSAVPLLTCTPYMNAVDVQFYRRYEPGHEGIDLTARQEIVIRAECSGTFRKHLYFHPTALRWQVNTEIWVGDYSVDNLFEPGNQVSEEHGRRQLDQLVADGIHVNAGDVLGRLCLAPGNEYAILHFGVHLGSTGEAICPLNFCTAEVRAQLQALAQRDHPDWQVCTFEIQAHSASTGLLLFL